MTSKQIQMGAGLLPPQHAVVTDEPAPAEVRDERRTARTLLAGAAVFSPALFTACVALDPGTLPREEAADFLPPIAEHTTAYVVSTIFQLGSMTCGIALAVLVALAFGRRFARTAGAAAVLLTLGYTGGMGFVGAKLVAADLTVDGQVRPGAEEIWNAVRSGPLFDVISWPLIMAAPGMLLLAVLMLRSRAQLGWWPGVFVIAGFVASSGEFPDPVTVAGWAALVPAVAALARYYVIGERQVTMGS
jgi:hypothetical protein